MATDRSDVLIIGGGTMGTAAGWALAQRGVRVTVLEQFTHNHTMGSHGGKTRIFRHAYAEGARYVPWTLEADKLWTELQDRTGIEILHRIGCVDISAPGHHRARNAHASAEAFNLVSEWLTGREANERWPIFSLQEDREVCYGPDAGFVDIAAALGSMLIEFTAAGGTFRDNVTVKSWAAGTDGVRVETSVGTFESDRLIVAAGAWSSRMLVDLGVPLEVRRKPVLWFDVDAESAPKAEPERMPVFIAEDDTGEFYGIPHFDVPGVKVGMHSGGAVVDPKTVDRNVVEADIRNDIWPFIQRTFKGFTGTVADTALCMYTMSPDEDFIIDRHPEHAQVSFAAGFSGHGFKFAPIIGEYLADLATIDATPIVDFAVSRFSGVKTS